MGRDAEGLLESRVPAEGLERAEDHDCRDEADDGRNDACGDPPDDAADLLLLLDDRGHPLFGNRLSPLLHGLPDHLCRSRSSAGERGYGDRESRPDQQGREPGRPPGDRVEGLRSARDQGPTTRQPRGRTGSGGGGPASPALTVRLLAAARRPKADLVRAAPRPHTLPFEDVRRREVEVGHGLAVDQPGPAARLVRASERSRWIWLTSKEVVIPFSNFFRSASRLRSASSRPFRAATIERQAVSIDRIALRTRSDTFCSVTVSCDLEASRLYATRPLAPAGPVQDGIGEVRGRPTSS